MAYLIDTTLLGRLANVRDDRGEVWTTTVPV